MVTSTCPDRDDLRSFHLGMLDELREQEVLDHLNRCSACEDTVANLEGTADSLVVAVRGATAAGTGTGAATADAGGGEDLPILQRALSEIESLVDAPSSPPTEVEHPAATASPVSERIRDYELLGTLGEGGMGTVYRARHTRLDRQVALKLLPARRLRDNAAVARFEREMKAIGRLDHPAIVRATDAGDVDGTHFLAMDYVEGIDLSKLVRLVGPLDVASACEIVCQAAIGLDYAHQQELIHRDVKPSNLMLTLRGEVRILDLGLALFGAASEALDELTTVGQLMGTLDYMAPEQGDNSHDVDARADVYSLGATLFKLLTATAPYDSPGTRTPLAKMKALATIDAPSIADRREGLPAELVTVVDRMLAREPDDRIASAGEVAESLLPFCEGHSLSDLAECGRNLASQEDEQIPWPQTLPPFVSHADPGFAEPVPRTGLTATTGGPGSGRRLARWMLIPLILLAGIVIWIQTDNGTLVVESPSGGIPIEIRTGGKFHRNETLSLGKNELTIHSGTYEIVLPKEYDSLTVENSVFTLKRGGQWIARISKTDQVDKPGTPGGASTDVTQSGFPGSDGMPPGEIPGNSVATPGMPPGARIAGAIGSPGSPSVPSRTPAGVPAVPGRSGTLVFSGKTFEEWQRAVLTERNPVELRKAVEALCVLGRNSRDAEATETVLRVIDAYPCNLSDGSDETALVASAIRHLRTLDSKSVAPAIAESIRSRGFNTRKLILDFLIPGREWNGNATFSNIGNGEPLASRLQESIEVRNSLLDTFDDLDPKNTLRAFDAIVENRGGKTLDASLISFLEIQSRKGVADWNSVRAARHLAERRPTAELADIFLQFLEKSDETLSQNRQDWWLLEKDAWFGLAALGKHAAGSVDRIVRITEGPPPKWAVTQTLKLVHPDKQSIEKFNVTRQLLAIEVLALIGPGARSAVPVIRKALHRLVGSEPSPQAHYGFAAGRDEVLLERIPQMSYGTPNNGYPTIQQSPPVRNIPERAERLNSAILAIQRITGELPRFDVSRIDANGPSGQIGGMESGYRSGGGSAGMMSGYGGEGEYGKEAPEQHNPRLVTYKGKSFAEWIDPQNVARSAMSLGDLRDVFMGTSLLARTPPERTSAAETAIAAFEHAIRQPWKLTPELRKFLVDTVEASYSHNPVGVLTPIEDTLAQVTPARQSFLLAELLVPVEESDFGFRLHERPFSREVVVNPQFPNAYNDLVENWDKHPAELQEAILQVEAHLPALGRKNSVPLLTRLLEESQDTIGDGAIPVATPTDLQLKASLILAATSPKDPTIQGQLEKLLAGILARPHVLRSRVDDETGKAPHLEKNAAAPTMRDLDADQLHAAVALKLACGGALTEATARQFATLIIQDTERHEIGTFRIVSPPDGSGRHGLPSGLGQFDTSGKKKRSNSAGGGDYSTHNEYAGDGYPGGAGSSGMDAGIPGPGIPGAAGYPVPAPGQMTAGKYPDDCILLHGKLGFSPDHGEFSRRVLLIQLLLSAPPEDAEVRSEIGEQLAASLLKRYPENFIPAPNTESDNASVYDLIEVGFRSGIRYRKRPTLKKDTEEIARFVDAAGAVVWSYLPNDRAQQLQMNRIAELQAAQTVGANPQKLYDGKPFEAWLQVVSTERSPERLAEAVQALTILGKGGRDAEAARAILGCIAPFSPTSRIKGSAEERLFATVDRRLREFDDQQLTPVLVDVILRGNSSQRQFILTQYRQQVADWSYEHVDNDRFRESLIAATHESAEDVRYIATLLLTPLLMQDHARLADDERAAARNRMIALLDGNQTRVPAAVCLSQLAPETPGLAEILLDGIEQFDKRGEYRVTRWIDPYWALRNVMLQNPTQGDQINERLISLLSKAYEHPSFFHFPAENTAHYFTHRTLLVELLATNTRKTASNAEKVRAALAAYKKLVTRLPTQKPGSSPDADSSRPSIGDYTVSLDSEYFFPSKLSVFQKGGGGRFLVEGEMHPYKIDVEFAAANWGLKQLEVAGTSRKADE